MNDNTENTENTENEELDLESDKVVEMIEGSNEDLWASYTLRNSKEERPTSVVAKKVLNGLVGFGVAAVANKAVKGSMPESDWRIVRGFVAASTYATVWAVKGFVGDFLSDYIEFRVDSTFAGLEAVQHEVDEFSKDLATEVRKGMEKEFGPKDENDEN